MKFLRLFALCCAMVAAPIAGLSAIIAKEDILQPGPEGYVTIKYCYKVVGTNTDGDPSDDQTITHIRKALMKWERATALRFTEFIPCARVSATDLPGYSVLRLTHDPKESTNASLGKWTVQQFPASNPDDYTVTLNYRGRHFNQCSASDFRCLEQYALHEFGHNIGLDHEHDRQDADTGCNMLWPIPPTKVEHIVSGTIPGAALPADTLAFGAFDRRSIMAYDDACKGTWKPTSEDTNAIRFGSSEPSPQDRLAVETLYPSPTKILPRNDVGVLANVAGGCGANEPITVYLDAEDSNPETVSLGWTGGSKTDRNAWLEFCRVKGDQFAALAAKRGSFMVLKLGESCPIGTTVGLSLDDEDGVTNENFHSGDIAPGFQDYNTTLQFCLAHNEDSSAPQLIASDFPVFGFSYGVFGPAALSTTYGQIWIDNEDDDNINRIFFPDSDNPGERNGIHPTKPSDFVGVFTIDRNLVLNLAKIR